ncbi:MAG: hypothetical protein J6I46_04835 [Ruminococcus sp.]|nr:hypothetical protein [Ruminococcus sp.]MBP3797086.1 hypothetical protein [Ruminococcus sp.]MBQ1432231.1 hypothetical protein [Ruminococcus sp.]
MKELKIKAAAVVAAAVVMCITAGQSDDSFAMGRNKLHTIIPIHFCLQ